ncbi:MAG: ATP-grasp domain-containing protein, partial [Acidimicrobiia bacterium]
QSLGLPHNPPEAAAATRDKEAMRIALSRGEVPQPSFEAIARGQDATEAATTIGFPLVVKPLSLSGSRGVIRVESHDRLAAVIERVLAIASEAGDDGGRVLLEQFVPGPEVALEGMVWSGTLEILAIFDKPDHPDGPYFEETIYVTPTQLDQVTQDEIARVTQAAITAIGLREGPIHAELRVNGLKPFVIEVAGRSIGGICGRALSFGLLDTSLETLILRHALGRRHRGLHRTARASGVMMLPITAQGTLTAIGGIDEAGRVEGVDAIEITTPIGAQLRPVPEADRYLGLVFASGPDPADVVATLKKAHSLLDIVIR